jgi:nucleoside-diphosphate-sugar epimerase
MALFADISKAKELLKWTPEVAIEDGLRRTVSYQISNTELQ